MAAKKKADAAVENTAEVTQETTEQVKDTVEQMTEDNKKELDNKKYVVDHLLSTKREGMEDLIDYMEQIGFFEAPCSGGNHLACKCGDFGKQMYVPNMIKDGKPTKAEPEQKYKQSESKPFKRNPELLPLDHATRSIKLATLFIDLTEEEEFAIRYHDGLYESANYGVKGNETALYLILHYADLW